MVTIREGTIRVWIRKDWVAEFDCATVAWVDNEENPLVGFVDIVWTDGSGKMQREKHPANRVLSFQPLTSR